MIRRDVTELGASSITDLTQEYERVERPVQAAILVMIYAISACGRLHLIGCGTYTYISCTLICQ